MQAAVKKKGIGKNLTQGPVLKTLLTFAIPIVLTNLIQQLYSMVDLIVIGHYMSSIGTVAVSTGGEVSDLMTPIASAFATAGQIFIAQLMGAQEKKKAHQAIGTLVTLMMSISLVFMVLTVFGNGLILRWLNCPSEAVSEASRYMVITAVGFPFIFGYNAVCSILRGMGEAKRPLFFIIVAAVVNIVLDLLLVVVIPLGAAGTAIATAGSQAGAFIASFLFMYKSRDQIGFELRPSFFKVRKEPLKVILKLAIPNLIRFTCVQFSMLWVKASINSYGLVESATNSVGNKLEKFINAFMQGTETGCGAMIAQNLGAKKHDRARQTLLYTVASCMIVAAIGSALYLLIPKSLFRIFTNDEAVVDFGVIYLRIMVVNLFAAAFAGSFKSMLSGAGEVMLGFLVGILDAVVFRIGISLFCREVLGIGIYSFFWGTALCQVVPGIISLVYFLSGKWKTKELLSESK